MPGPHRWAIGCDRPMAHQVPIPNTSAAKLSRVPHLTRLRVLVAALAHELNRQREKEHRPKATLQTAGRASRVPVGTRGIYDLAACRSNSDDPSGSNVTMPMSARTLPGSGAGQDSGDSAQATVQVSVDAVEVIVNEPVVRELT